MLFGTTEAISWIFELNAFFSCLGGVKGTKDSLKYISKAPTLHELKKRLVVELAGAAKISRNMEVKIGLLFHCFLASLIIQKCPFLKIIALYVYCLK